MGLIKKVGATRGIGGQAPVEHGAETPATAAIARNAAPNPDVIPQPDDLGTVDPSNRRGSGSIQTLAQGTLLANRYHIEGPLGVGGMSVVYRGRDMRFKDVVRLCAIKEMLQSAPDSNTRLFNLKNFEREAGLLATLHHPAIPKIYDFFEDNNRIYLVLELIPGKDLETVLEAAGKPLDEVRVAQWAIQICDVLGYLHQHEPEPIVFRDMKPSNVMAMPDDRIVLIDFGIARSLNRSTQKGTMIGTEGYSPPEQYRGLAEPQGDIYALGATLHHLLTRTDPRLETPFTFQDRPLRQYNPTISEAMEQLVNKALEYDMTKRWATVEELKQALYPLAGLAQAGAAVVSVAPARSTPARGMPTTELLWSFQCEEEVRSSPCVVGSSLYIGCYDTNLYALDISRGEFRWKYPTDGGISSSPVVWQDTVIFGSEDGAVYAVDGRTGKIRWTQRTVKPIRSSPRVEDRMVYVGSDDMHFYALDGRDGSIFWKVRAWNPFRSSACIVGDSVYVGCNDNLVYCIDSRKGNVKWKTKTQQPVISSPTFAEGMVLVGSMDGHLYALDRDGGWVVWKQRTGSAVNSSPCVMGSRVFVGSADGNLYCYDVKNGRLAWKFETGSQIASSPRVEGGRVYFGAIDMHVYCLDASAGTLVWKYPTNGVVVSSPAIANGVVYIGSLDHMVYALKA